MRKVRSRSRLTKAQQSFIVGYRVGFNKAKRVGIRKLRHRRLVHETSSNEDIGHPHYWHQVSDHKWRCVDCGAVQYRR